MKAMVLAAGLGTRLRPLTDDRPKALVELNGRTLVEITLSRLRDFGIRDVILNVHHVADMVVAHLKKNGNFGMNIALSREDDLLRDTGGGLKKAAWFFQDDTEPFLLHNVDVISTIDFGAMLRAHEQRAALATLAVQDRKTSRYLLFDQELRLCGRRSGADGKPEMARPCPAPQALAFAGIHVISPRLLPKLPDEGVFPIIPSYLRLAGEGEPIIGFRSDQWYWRDLGRPDDLRQAAEDLQRGLAK